MNYIERELITKFHLQTECEVRSDGEDLEEFRPEDEEDVGR